MEMEEGAWIEQNKQHETFLRRCKFAQDKKWKVGGLPIYFRSTKVLVTQNQKALCAWI